MQYVNLLLCLALCIDRYNIIIQFVGTASNEGYDNPDAEIGEYLADFFGYDSETQNVSLCVFT